MNLEQAAQQFRLAYAVHDDATKQAAVAEIERDVARRAIAAAREALGRARMDLETAALTGSTTEGDE